MHALTTTRQLLQEVRDLREREDVPQQPKQSNQPKQSKRRRMEDIKSQAMENLLTGIVEANIEMHGLFMRMAVFDTVTPLEERGTHTHSAELKQLNS